uniref:Sphingomyelin synthase-like domain-containing protein n=1 Tax=Acrobeloides nanus TaxID=290746 RepID=A0A914BX21_9BILA
MPEILPLVTSKNEVSKLTTMWAFVLVAAGWFANELALAWIHDRVPRQVEPLPDLWFSIFPEVRGAIHVTEYIMLFLVVNALIVVICHQHRWIVMRRVFFCAALAYAFRAICITLLQVPVPSKNTYCAPKGDGSLATTAERIVRTFWSAGIEQLRPRELCGDLIVSGHTLTLFLAVLTFRQYTPRRLTYLGYVYQGLSYIAIICILLSRKHYCIDVLLGYVVVTRIFWTYHSLQYSFHQGEFDRNALSQTCWAWIVAVFEMDAPPPNLFLNVLEWPSSCPSKIRRTF